MSTSTLNYEENDVSDYAYDYEKPKNDDLERKAKATYESGFCNRMIGGMVLVGMGGYFMLKALGLSLNFEWWALLMVIIGAGMLLKAGRNYLRLGFLPKELRDQAGFGTVVSVIGLIFLLNVSWSLILPLFLIVPGVLILLAEMSDDEPFTA
jgi:hypothetical protein